MNRAWMFVVLAACSPSNVASPTSGAPSAAPSGDSPVAPIASTPPVAPIASTPPDAPIASTPPVAPSAAALPSSSASSAPNVVASGTACVEPILAVRLEANPRTADFTRGADAFDRASTLHGQRRFREAAQLFFEASKRFAAASHESNWKYALYNARICFELADRVAEGKKAFDDAAATDAAHADDLRSEAAKMTKRQRCK